MPDPLVSIIIPAYNAEKYIAETIKSALDQTWQHKEIIVVDDGSTDGTLTIAKQFESTILKVLHQQNKGASAARNLGMQQAKGSYIQFLDADDLISHDKIAAQVECLTGYEDHVGLCKTAYFNDGDDYLKGISTEEWFSSGANDPVDFLIKLYAGNEVITGYGGMIQPNAWLTPKAIIEKAGPWNENLTVDDDGEFFCRVILASNGIRYSSTGINYYRKFNNRQSLSGSRSLQSFESIRQSIDLKMRYLKESSVNPLIDKVFARHYWWAGVHAYPKYKSISSLLIKKAMQLNYTGDRYHAGPFTNLITKFFGWRLARLITYLRYKY